VAAAEKKGVNARLVDSKDLVLDVTGKRSGVEERVILQRSVSHYRNIHSTAALESLGHRVVNSFNAASIASNKLFGSLALVKARVPTPKTHLAFSEDGVYSSLEKLGYPAVIKPVVGSWGRLSALLKDKDFAKAIVEDREYMYPLYQVYYLQEFVKRPPRDIRSFVIGDKTVAAIYRISLSDWRTNTARGGKAEACPITEEVNELSLRAAKAVDGEVVGVDLMESPDGLVVHEVNNTIEFKNTVPATGVDIPSLIVDYLISLEKR
jgi:[lysine-biosynthesis-protein LysW]---L-2-aminoadipate ligase